MKKLKRSNGDFSPRGQRAIKGRILSGLNSKAETLASAALRPRWSVCESSARLPNVHEVLRERETAAEGAEESRDSREEGSGGQDGRKEGSDLSVVFSVLSGKDEGSAEEPGAHRPAAGSHGRPADFCGLTKAAVGELWTRWDGGLVGFMEGLFVACLSRGARRAQSRPARRLSALVTNLIHRVPKSRKT